MPERCCATCKHSSWGTVELRRRPPLLGCQQITEGRCTYPIMARAPIWVNMEFLDNSILPSSGKDCECWGPKE